MSLSLEMIAPRSCSHFRFFLCMVFFVVSIDLSPGFHPPREAGADDVAALASRLLLGFSSPKGSWGGVDVDALASG